MALKDLGDFTSELENLAFGKQYKLLVHACAISGAVRELCGPALEHGALLHR